MLSGRERDADLRLRVLRGDVRAWETLYDAHFERLWRVVRSRVSDVHSAEDVVQEAWTVAVAKIREFDPARGGFGEWLGGIAINVLRNHSRRRAVAENAVAELESIADSTEGVDRLVVQEILLESWDTIPAHYQGVLRQKYVDGLSMNEIAARMNETVKAVESLLSRARAAFREHYGRLNRDGDAAPR